MVRREATEFDFETEDPVEYVFYPEETLSVTQPEVPIVTSNIAGHFALSLPTKDGQHRHRPKRAPRLHGPSPKPPFP